MDIFRPDNSSTKRLPATIHRLSARVQEAANFLHFDRGEPYTPLQRDNRLSQTIGANIFLKLESESPTGAYKSRGAQNALQGVKKAVTASAGNHAQGFAYSFGNNGGKGIVYMPTTTPDFKVARTREFGGDNVEVVLTGNNFDEASHAMREFAAQQKVPIIHPFDDWSVIAGQGTIALEILADMREKPIDYLIIPAGGGGLSAGMATWMAIHSPRTQIIIVEPENADAMKKSMEKGTIITLDHIDTFVDGAAVKTPGKKNFDTLHVLPNVSYMTVGPGAVSHEMCQLHDYDKKVVEPAGALSVTALRELAKHQSLEGKNVICVVTGGNIGMERWGDIRRRSYEHLGQEQEFKIAIRNTPGALREVLEKYVNGNQIVLLRFDHLEGPDYVACSMRLRNIADPTKISETEKRMTEAGILWGDRPEESHISDQYKYPYRKHFILKLPNRPGALLEALRLQTNTTNIIGFDYTNQTSQEARCSITIASKTEEDMHTFIQALSEKGFT